MRQTVQGEVESGVAIPQCSLEIQLHDGGFSSFEL